MTRRAAVAVFALALAVRVALIARFPIMVMGDGYTRLAHVDRLVQMVWLPGYQLGLYALSPFTRDPLPYRLETALQGALAAAVVTGVLARRAPKGQAPWGALGAGLMLAVAPPFLVQALGLYQEPLLVLLLATAAWAFDRTNSPTTLQPGQKVVSVGVRPRHLPLLIGQQPEFWRLAIGAGAMALATLVRYEAWLALPLALVVVLRRPEPLPARIGAALAMLAPPVVWIAYWGGLSPLGTGSLDLGLTPARLAEHAHAIAALWPWWVGWPVLALAAVGLARLVADLGGVAGPRAATDGGVDATEATDGGVDPLVLASLAWGVLDVAFVVLARPFVPLDNYRQLTVPVVAMLPLAAVGTDAVVAYVSRWSGLGGHQYPQRDAGGHERLAAGGHRRPTRAVLTAVVLLLLWVPPFWHVAAVASWEPLAFAEKYVAIGAALPVDDRHRVLVLADGFPGGPQYEPNECLAVTVGTRRAHDDVLCDSDVPELPDADALAAWLRARDVAWVLPLETSPWRTVHRVVADSGWRALPDGRVEVPVAAAVAPVVEEPDDQGLVAAPDGR